MSNLLTGKPQLNRVVNRRLILDRIRRVGSVSRADLAKVTAIRPPTVSAVVKQLIEEGLVEEVGNGTTSGGRAPRMISLSRKQPRALGFEMSETSILAGVCDLAGEICDNVQVPFTPQSPQESVERLYEIGSRLLGKLKINWSSIDGVGVAIPGHLNAAEGHVRWSRPFNWRDVPFKKLCESRWKIRTDVVNDSLAGGMAAHLYDANLDANNLVFLYVRFMDASHGVVGLGSGIIINGEPYHGEFGAAGEITTPIRHPLLHAKEQYDTVFDDVKAFISAFEEGHPAAVGATRMVADELSTLVLHIINLFEPGILVVNSDAPSLRDTLLEQWREVFEAHRLAYEPGKTRIVASSLGELSVVRGAVAPTLQRVFRMPRWT